MKTNGRWKFDEVGRAKRALVAPRHARGVHGGIVEQVELHTLAAVACGLAAGFVLGKVLGMRWLVRSAARLAVVAASSYFLSNQRIR